MTNTWWDGFIEIRSRAALLYTSEVPAEMLVQAAQQHTSPRPTPRTYRLSDLIARRKVTADPSTPLCRLVATAWLHVFACWVELSSTAYAYSNVTGSKLTRNVRGIHEIPDPSNRSSTPFRLKYRATWGFYKRRSALPCCYLVVRHENLEKTF